MKSILTAAAKKMKKGSVVSKTSKVSPAKESFDKPSVEKSSKMGDDIAEDVQALNKTEDVLRKSPINKEDEIEKSSDERKVEKLKASQQPEMVNKAKTFYGEPRKKEGKVENFKAEEKRPSMTRSKTTVEKPKSKACNLM